MSRSAVRVRSSALTGYRLPTTVLAALFTCPDITRTCTSGFALVSASNVLRKYAADANSKGPNEQHDHYLEPVAGGITECLYEGEGHNNQEDRTHRRLSQHRFYTAPFAHHKLHSMCLPLRERLAGLKRTITAMANTISNSFMTMPTSPPVAGEARKKLKPVWNKAAARMLPLVLL